MTTEAVFKFLNDQNRPFSVNDIQQNISKDHGKTAIQKALDKLVSDERIFEKVYGKQKVYCVVQDKEETTELMNKEIQRIDGECAKLADLLKTTEEKVKKIEAEYKKITSTPKTEDAKKELSELLERIETKRQRLNGFQNQNRACVSNEDRSKIVKRHEKVLMEYRKRKRICLSIIDSIMEGYPKTKKHLIEEIGIETDESVGFKLNC